ncbi:xylan 1,4-beta-xylosidase [Opitutaceae bacterium EW11]|nr:xylan 1,4-beta-xylosidase [Opitutaceae bacterium EW11]
MNESYHTQHSPFGAFASFTVGLVDSPGGFGQALRGPAKQNVYVGFKRGSAPWQLLPFFKPVASAIGTFTGEAKPDGFGKKTHALRANEYRRTLNWATDEWTFDQLHFALSSPFARIPDAAALPAEQARFHFAPLVCGSIGFDNSTGKEPVQVVFGLSEPDLQVRPLQETHADLNGFAGGNSWGFATAPSNELSFRQSFGVFEENPADFRGLHVLGSECALVFTVPAGAKRDYPLVLGFYQPGVITTGIEAKYAFTEWFSSLEEVLRFGLANHGKYLSLAAERDRELAASKLNADQKFLLAQATHSYLGSSQLLRRREGLLWNVNEGEYRMINTFDLTVDHLFFELEWHPWAVRNALDFFVERYSYTDRIRTPEGQLVPGGLSFTHDMGVTNHFTLPGRSSYECDNLTGCFSHMTMEQLLNWVLTALTYVWRTGDWAWLQKHRTVLQRCLESMELRDHPEPAKRDGVLKCDSDRCGKGSEITTYDSLDVSLGQARNNLYLAVKALGAWLLLERTYSKLNDTALAARSQQAIERLQKTIVGRFENDTGFFPAVFEKGNRSRILPAVEGFVYPLYLGMEDSLKQFAPLFACLRRHLKGAFQRGVCLDETSGGWKMSSTSKNTWFSKIALAQHVVRRLFPDTLNDEARAADRVHANWQRTPGCGANAMCDQIHSDTGEACGSRYYPRGVTAFLWLQE